METKLLSFFLVSNILKQTKRKLIMSLLNILYSRKSVTFLNEGTFTLTSSVQEVYVIFK